MSVQIRIADYYDLQFAEEICAAMEEAAKQRGTGIAKRKPEYLRKKMQAGNAVIALVEDQVAGFCYVETWDHGKYIANSGLIVFPQFRGLGLARKIKARIFQLSREKYPKAKVFGITTSLAVMKINSDLGYRPVTFSELPKDEAFWKGCSSCVNYDILNRMERKICLCTGMLADPKTNEKQTEDNANKESSISL
ncbi:MAG: GNAT family N-acetyltransferase [Bacteroidota bacterium]